MNKVIGIIDDRDPSARGATEMKPAVAPPEEHEVWWGAYSGWTMLPSWAVCLLLAVLILCGAWYFELPRGWLQTTVWSLVGAVCLAQLVRWGYRMFSYNYRLTNRRLFRDTGFFHDDRIRIDLKLIKKVEVRALPYEMFFGIGKVLITTDESLPPIVLKGVHQPRVVATLIDEYRKQA